VTNKRLGGYEVRCAQVAQSVEQGIENPRVGGSIPSLGTTSNFEKITQLQFVTDHMLIGTNNVAAFGSPFVVSGSETPSTPFEHDTAVSNTVTNRVWHQRHMPV
jgi:hypothetical protein